MGRKFLLFCGVIASLLYIVMNIFIPPLYEGYNWVTQTVSELSAVDAPTRPLWFVLGIIYTLFVAVFGYGVLLSAGQKKSLRVVGVMMIINGIMGITWSPMHQREVLATGGGTFTDVWHIVMTIITLLCMFLSISFGAAALGKGFRLFSIAIIVVFLVFGYLISTEAGNVDKNLPTPFIGLWERINIASFMVWLFVFAIMLLRIEKRSSLSKSSRKDERKMLNKQFAETKETVQRSQWK